MATALINAKCFKLFEMLMNNCFSFNTNSISHKFNYENYVCKSKKKNWTGIQRNGKSCIKIVFKAVKVLIKSVN